MHQVILRDDDTNALTPVECLEQLYRPFLQRGLPVNLAVIPRVRTDAKRADGEPERFLWNQSPENPRIEPLNCSSRRKEAHTKSQGLRFEPPHVGCYQVRGDGVRSVPLAANAELVHYLHDNPGFHLAQHGYHHSLYEFDTDNVSDIRSRIEQGAELFAAAGFARPTTFVAPHDKFSPASLGEVAKRFRTISAGWFELRRLPKSWWPRYLFKKLSRRPHWRIGQTLLLSHPGCLLSCNRSTVGMLDEIKRSVRSQPLTVLVTHWWEYFADGKPVEPFLQVLHQTAAWLASERDIKVICFDDLSARMIANSRQSQHRPAVITDNPLPARQ